MKRKKKHKHNRNTFHTSEACLCWVREIWLISSHMVRKRANSWNDEMKKATSTTMMMMMNLMTIVYEHSLWTKITQWKSFYAMFELNRSLWVEPKENDENKAIKSLDLIFGALLVECGSRTNIFSPLFRILNFRFRNFVFDNEFSIYKSNVWRFFFSLSRF